MSDAAAAVFVTDSLLSMSVYCERYANHEEKVTEENENLTELSETKSEIVWCYIRKSMKENLCRPPCHFYSIRKRAKF